MLKFAQSLSVGGKCILAGEHAVLRGSPALVLPVSTRSLELKYDDSSSLTLTSAAHTFLPRAARGRLIVQLDHKLESEQEENLQKLFEQIESWASAGESLASIQESVLQISSQIPMGAGLGSSAALCVALARWAQHVGIMRSKGGAGGSSSQMLLERSRTLENIFHGQSSGVDVAVALFAQPLCFKKGNAPEVLPLEYLPPYLFLSDSGVRCSTAETVRKVEELARLQPQEAARWDEQMQRAVLGLRQIMTKPFEGSSFDRFAECIHLAYECFAAWGLVAGSGGALQAHMQMLRDAGAVALKPTGKGAGGYVLSLWKEPPPERLLKKCGFEFFPVR